VSSSDRFIRKRFIHHQFASPIAAQSSSSPPQLIMKRLQRTKIKFYARNIFRFGRKFDGFERSLEKALNSKNIPKIIFSCQITTCPGSDYKQTEQYKHPHNNNYWMTR